MSYGNDFTRENNPLECNLEKYCRKEDDHDSIGKEALRKIQSDGIKQQIRGVICLDLRAVPWRAWSGCLDRQRARADGAVARARFVRMPSA